MKSDINTGKLYSVVAIIVMFIAFVTVGVTGLFQGLSAIWYGLFLFSVAIFSIVIAFFIAFALYNLIELHRNNVDLRNVSETNDSYYRANYTKVTAAHPNLSHVVRKQLAEQQHFNMQREAAIDKGLAAIDKLNEDIANAQEAIKLHFEQIKALGYDEVKKEKEVKQNESKQTRKK